MSSFWLGYLPLVLNVIYMEAYLFFKTTIILIPSIHMVQIVKKIVRQYYLKLSNEKGKFIELSEVNF